jgi:hypothetical protein
LPMWQHGNGRMTPLTNARSFPDGLTMSDLLQSYAEFVSNIVLYITNPALFLPLLGTLWAVVTLRSAYRNGER